MSCVCLRRHGLRAFGFVVVCVRLSGAIVLLCVR